MIRSNPDHRQPVPRRVTPPDPEAVAHADEILRETSGMWDSDDGAKIIAAIEEAFESPASKTPPREFR